MGKPTKEQLKEADHIHNAQKFDIYFNFIVCSVPPKPEVILTAEKEAKVQKALAARNREREQNRLRMRRVREAQRAAREAGKVFLSAG